MGLDDLARPFGIEQVGVALRRVVRRDQLRVVAEHRQRGAVGGIKAIGVARLIAGQRATSSGTYGASQPCRFQESGCAISVEFDGVDRVDVAGIFLVDALEDALGAGTLDLRRDARIFRLEGSAEPSATSRSMAV